MICFLTYAVAVAVRVLVDFKRKYTAWLTIGGWGWLTGAERMPPPGIQAQRPRTRTARTTRQINGAILFGG